MSERKAVTRPKRWRSAITGRFMSVPAARAHKKTAIVEGQRKKNKS